VILELSIVLLMILMNGYFAMAEIALVTSRRARLKQMANEKKPGAYTALRLLEDPSSFLSTVQVGVTLNGVLAGVFSGATIAQRLGEFLDTYENIAPHGKDVAIVFVVVVVTYITLIIGELVPKRIGGTRAEELACIVAAPLAMIARIMRPVIWVLKASTDLVLRLLRIGGNKAARLSEEEVKHIIAEGAQAGVIQEGEKKMLEGVMRLADRTVRGIMTPRIDMVWLGIDEPLHEVQKAIRTSGYSRFPVARGDMEEVVGIVHAKDLLKYIPANQPVDLAALKRPALIMPDTTPVLKLLEEFRKSGQHQAIVVDEYGSVEGLVTVTDILSAIAGELPELGEESGNRPFQRKDGSWLIDGMTPIDEVEALLGLREMKGDGDFHTLAGFVLFHMGRVPQAGDSFDWQDARFEVIDMDGRRIDKVLIMPPSPADEGMEYSG